MSVFKATNWAPHPDLKGIWGSKSHVTINWGGYEYDIAWNRINSQEDLLSWVHHLAEKSWMNGVRISILIEFVMKERGWKIRDV